MSEKERKELIELRHSQGLYSIKELMAMFGIGRHALDFAMNSGQLKWMSPNNRERFVYMSDFLLWMEKGGKKDG